MILSLQDMSSGEHVRPIYSGVDTIYLTWCQGANGQSYGNHETCDSRPRLSFLPPNQCIS